MNKILLLLITLIFVSTPTHAKAEELVGSDSNGIEVDYDEFKQETKYRSQPIEIGQYGSSYWHVIFLRAFKTGKGAVSNYQIYVDTHYRASRLIGYKSAYDFKGAKLPLSAIDHEVVSCDGDGRCLFDEVFAIRLNQKYLESRSKLDEVEFKIEGVGDYLTFGIDGSYMKKFLQDVNKIAKAEKVKR